MNANTSKPMCEKEQKMKRTLYECAHARVTGERIRCRRGHVLLRTAEDGGIDAAPLAQGKPLAYRVCWGCPDFEAIGPPVPPEERGWLRERRDT